MTINNPGFKCMASLEILLDFGGIGEAGMDVVKVTHIEYFHGYHCPSRRELFDS
ncbi:MAG: hypothetical protein KGY39_08790 [Anaerolineales bacterium]|nr:hypothetical protein [Anaerolineales bacterium]